MKPAIAVLSVHERKNRRVTENWQLMAGYAYLDSHVAKSAAGAALIGTPLINTPKNAFSFFTEIMIRPSRASVGMAAIGKSQRSGNEFWER